MSRLLLFIALVIAWRSHAAAPPLREAAGLGLRVAEGFEVSLYADADLADNSYCMATDSLGRIVVSGPGYVRILHDTDGDGRADQGTLFTTLNTGAMGMAFDGRDLYAMANGGIWRFRDSDADDRADGPGELIVSVATGEHGGHALRKGPDGTWTFIGGNDAKFGPQHATAPAPIIRQPEGGALLRFDTNMQNGQFIVQGMRNAYDFDFNSAGDIFTYDSDVERDFLLPWYTPTRIYHLAYGGHHGWRLPGYLRSWDRPDHYDDVAEMMWPVGRGSPTGVAVYRHSAFPERYRDGLFALDWTFGTVWFVPLAVSGGSYTGKGEVFMEPIGSAGFAPNDVAVGPDGSLFISIGGRKTRGGVYKVTARNPGPPRNEAGSALEQVLRAPQPLDAWSRAKWTPLARQLGAETFRAAIADGRLSLGERVRAVEVHRELFGPLPSSLAQMNLPTRVRARALWAAEPAATNILWTAAARGEPLLARAALERLLEIGAEQKQWTIDGSSEAHLARALASRHKRVRAAAIAVAQRLPTGSWQSVLARIRAGKTLHARVALSAAFVLLTRNEKGSVSEALDLAFTTLKESKDDFARLQALRVVMLACGDWNLHKPSVEIYTAYELAQPQALSAKQREELLALTRGLIPSRLDALNVEAARVLAMFRDQHPAALQRTTRFLSGTTSPVAEFHYLIAISRLQAPWPPGLAREVARTVLSLEGKLSGREHRTKQNWSLRRNELTLELLKRDGNFAAELLGRRRFPTAGHVPLALALPKQYRAEAANRYLKAVSATNDFEWSPALVELLADLPAARPLLRKQAGNFALRDSLTLALANQPQEVDRGLLIAGLGSSQNGVAQAALRGLQALPFARSEAERASLARALQIATQNPKDVAWRRALAQRASEQLERPVDVAEPDAAAAIAPAYRQLIAALMPEDAAARSAERLVASLTNIATSAGTAARGREIFEARACLSCHSGAGAIGPDLSGVAARMSAADLFASIADPDASISEAYRSLAFEMKDGETQTGLLAFESADGVILQTGPGTTVRLADKDIANRRISEKSIMPAGLLDGLNEQDLADLYAYLKTLTGK